MPDIDTPSDNSNIVPQAQAISVLSANDHPLKKIERAFSKGELNDWDRAISGIAKVVSEHPSYTPKLVSLVANHFAVAEWEVSKQLDLLNEGRVEDYRFEEALNFLANRVTADYAIKDILPGHLGEVIATSCELSNVDWKSALFLLLATTSGLTGNRVVCTSPRSHKPISLSLMVLNCGDSSANKDITSGKIMDAMSGLAELEKLRRDQALGESRKLTDADQRKAEEQRITKNRSDVLCQGISFSAESIVFEVSNRQPRNGFHIHQKEGSDFLACERWGSGQSQNSSGPGLLRKTFMEAWDGPLDGEYMRQSSDKCASFRKQSMSLTLNCQMRFVPEIVDFDEDGLGWTSRLLVVLAKELDNGNAPRKKRGVDPLTDYIKKRLIPFTQAIETRKSSKVSSSGFAMDFVQLELDEWDRAEHRYEDFCNETAQEIKKAEALGIEPAYLSFLKKTPVRIMKFASLLHIFETIEGKQIPEQGIEFDYQTYAPSCDPNTELTKNGGISIETFERAIMLEMLARSQYQTVADLCRTAPAKRLERKEVGQDLTLAGTLLEKLQRYGEIPERQFQDKVKSRKLSRQQIVSCINQLVKQGKVIRTPIPGRAGFTLSFNDDLRG